jgi:hypothetical protein
VERACCRLLRIFLSLPSAIMLHATAPATSWCSRSRATRASGDGL